jgi:predicted RNA-binding Zn-ribbon protein involved in translation (DUF1610 family)
MSATSHQGRLWGRLAAPRLGCSVASRELPGHSQGGRRYKKIRRVCPSCGGPIGDTGLTFCPHCGAHVHTYGSKRNSESAESSPATSTGGLSILLLPFKLLIGIVKALVQGAISLGR